MKNQMLVVPAAKGKTRIAMAIAVGMNFKYGKSLENIVIVYDNDVLFEQDIGNWDKLKLFGNYY